MTATAPNPHRCPACGEMWKDVLDDGAIRQSCPCAEPIVLVDVVRGLWARKREGAAS